MFDSLAVILGTTLMYSTPLIFTALGGVISENSGVINIGLEGMMVLGAFVAAAVGYYLGNPWIAFLAAGLAGGFLGLLHAIACVSFQANQIVSGIAINFLGPGLAIFLSRIFFDGATTTLSIDLNNKMPRPLNSVFSSDSFFYYFLGNRYATVFLAFILVFLLWFILNKTKLGLRIKSVGEHPRAAETLGINVYKVRYFSVIFSGVFSGFGGAAMSLAIVSNFRPTLISGHGFIALAAMIFGKWKPQGAMLACLLFGFSQGLAIYLGQFDLNISSQILSMIPYLLTLVILIGFVGRSRCPAADGIPYKRR
ncbi:MAG: ABC transporter permease [Candidatus Cloacimonetes bacterium]|nr:ABC transporter permease [Candidatus Cloacimonadota bacterium]MCF7815089.1 ABC transporter permease [Candidatus Cloacimonadota bacterium]MCF7869313.1 ABC transporter permease [Candidatus Cloacimonadota bacterium]MCF7884735.1 ABC transporter permease [Candidatus Cloacimonadota bacterium]